MKSPFSLPRGARFDLNTKQWSVGPTPTPRGTAYNIAFSDQPMPAGQRGLVVGPPTTATHGFAEFRGGSIDPQELRFAGLFWDRLIYPRNNLFHQSLGPDVEFLQQAGVLYTADVRLQGSRELGEAFTTTYLETLRALVERDGDRWSLARGENSLSLLAADGPADGALVFDLHRVIPVPDKQVPLAEVLEFKLRRDSELRTLQGRIDELFVAIVANPEQEFAKRREMDALAAAIHDHLVVSRETKFPLRLSGFKAKLDAKTWAGGSAAFAGATSYGMPPAIAALAGVGGAVLTSISMDVGWRGFHKTASPYEYVSRYHSDLFA